jgi:hypothetical protein
MGLNNLELTKVSGLSIDGTDALFAENVERKGHHLGVVHSPAAIVAAWPTTVRTSR